MEAKSRCSVREFAEWIAYDRIDPIGSHRDDMRMAVLATVVARASGSKTAQPKDFMPNFEANIRKQNVESMASTFRQFVARHNAEIKRRSRNGGG